MHSNASPDRHAPRPRNVLRKALLIGSICAVAMALAAVKRGVSKQSIEDPFAAFCTPVPNEATVPATTNADKVFSVVVPSTNPGPEATSMTSLAIRPNEVIEFRVATPRIGAIAVHGLSELVRLEPGTTGVVRMRAIYEGRYSLHFHGLDQSHFEIAVLEVRRLSTEDSSLEVEPQGSRLLTRVRQ